MTPPVPLTRDLVLIGGGHAHALALRMWGMKPMAGVRVTVINPGPTAPYTGMLPGFIAGHYTCDELEIDLVKLCRFAGARLVLTKACGINRAAKTLQVEGRPDIGYDVASFDIGIHSAMPEVKGFGQFGLPAKPLDRFANGWEAFLSDVRSGALAPSVAVIGGGIAGAELALAMSHRLTEIGASPSISLIEAGPKLSGVIPSTQRRLNKALVDAGIALHLNAKITNVGMGEVILDGKIIPSNLTVGAAGAKPYSWLSSTDLPLSNGFITVGTELALTDDPDVFATGDCSHLAHSPRPKAGVFAVRAAPVLLHNLKARLSGGACRPFKPQKTYLKLISLGRKSAIAEKAALSFSSDAMWRWKDQIDQKFMDQFRNLPKMASATLPEERALDVSSILSEKPLCGGCGAKIGPDVLHDALCGLAEIQRYDVLTKKGDDAAVLKIGGRKQVISVDHLRAFDEDHWRMARIATVHALGDVWAMGAEPQSVLVSLTLPRMSAQLQSRTLVEIMDGVQSISQNAGAEIVGGHTSMGAELSIGLTVTGLLPKGKDAITIGGAKSGDALILTRPIGSGTILAAEMAMEANGADVSEMLSHLQTSQASAADILTNAHAMTDVTGFGLGGHLLAMCRASGSGAKLNLDNIPVFNGSISLNRIGHRSSIYEDNAKAAEHFSGLRGEIGELLFDPQTSGGLLAAVNPREAIQVVENLRMAGYIAAQIGTISDQVGRIECA